MSARCGASAWAAATAEVAAGLHVYVSPPSPSPSALSPAATGIASAATPLPAAARSLSERAVLLLRFNASHDSWELEDNVSEELAAAFRESHG